MTAAGSGCAERAARLGWAAIALLAVACVPHWKRAPHDRVYQQAEPPTLHARPESIYPSDWWDRVQNSTVLPLARLVSPARALARVAGGRPALDINDFGNVPDSEWFENRIGRKLMSEAELARGPNRGDRPTPGKLIVISGKPEGVSPGVVVRDGAGAVWFVKFDPPAYPELTTGAEMVASRLLYAAGYHVPESWILDVDLARFEVGPGARTHDDYNRDVPLTEEGLRVLLLQLNPSPAGRVRGLFSKAVPGQPLGPFSYRGTRADDPNDRLPHQRRRSLRGLWVFSAWLNNTDTRAENSLDTFVPVSVVDGVELGFVRHYLLDFGDSLGAAGTREKLPANGYEAALDWREMFLRTIALGLRYPYWLRVRRSPYRSVGIFEADNFDPARWSPQLSNPAFVEATALDTLWATSILARFTPELIRAAVETARYSTPAAAQHVGRVLVERRERLLRFGFERFLPLVDPVVTGPYSIELTDLEVASGLQPEPVTYRWEIVWSHSGGVDRVLGGGTGERPLIDLRDAVIRAMTQYPARFSADPYLTVRLRRAGKSAALRLHVRVVRDHVLPVGLEHEPG